MNVIRLECDFMTVKDLVSKLRMSTSIELREDNFYLLNSNSDNKAMEEYKNREVIDWFPHIKLLDCPIIVINIKGEYEE